MSYEGKKDEKKAPTIRRFRRRIRNPVTTYRRTRTAPYSRMQVTQSIKKVINDEIDKSFRRTDVTEDGIGYLNLVLDPFNQAHGGAIITRKWCVPDGLPKGMTNLAFHCDTTFSGATATEGMICLLPPNATNMGALEIVYGTNPEVDGNAPTAVASLPYNENTLGAAIHAYSGNRSRFVAGGLRVILESSVDTSSGMLYPWFGDYIPPRSAAAAYRTYGTFRTERVSEDPHSVFEGMTIRAPHDAVNDNGQAFSPTIYTAWSGVYGRMPMILFKGLSATTVLRIQAVMYIQIPVRDGYTPIPSPISDREPEWEMVRQFANTCEYVTTAHSFKSFFQNIGKGLLKAFKFVSKIATPVGMIAKGFASLAI